MGTESHCEFVEIRIYEVSATSFVNQNQAPALRSGYLERECFNSFAGQLAIYLFQFRHAEERADANSVEITLALNADVLDARCKPGFRKFYFQLIRFYLLGVRGNL